MGLCTGSWRALCCACWASDPRTSSSKHSTRSSRRLWAQLACRRGSRPAGRWRRPRRRDLLGRACGHPKKNNMTTWRLTFLASANVTDRMRMSSGRGSARDRGPGLHRAGGAHGLPPTRSPSWLPRCLPGCLPGRCGHILSGSEPMLRSALCLRTAALGAIGLGAATLGAFSLGCASASRTSSSSPAVSACTRMRTIRYDQ